MKQIIKWGVIGSGGIANRRTIPEGIIKAENTKLISVYDIDIAVNHSVAKAYNALACDTIDELLASDIDAVYVASPANLHLEHVIMCANANKHILCEKPIGISVQESEKMLKICEETGVILGVGLMMRFHAQHQAALRLVEEGKLGKLVYGRAQLSCWYPPIEGAWRQDIKSGGGGSLMDMGSHCVDLLEMYFGKIKSLSCFTNNNIHPYSSEDSAVATFMFESGAIATVDSCFCIPDNSSKNILELYGSKGSIIAKNTIGQGESGEMIAYLEKNDTGYDATQSRSVDNGIFISPAPINMYKSEIQEFNSAIRENRTPVNSANIGFSNQLIIASCYEAANSKRIIEVDY